MSDPPLRRWWRSRWLQVTLSGAVVVVIFGFLFPKVADYREVRQTITGMTAIELVTLGLLAIWNLVSYWPALTAVLPGLRAGEAAVGSLASTAVANTLPGGGALGLGVTVKMERSWGIALPDIALAGLVSGIWNNFVKLGLPVVALGLLAAGGEAGAALATAAVAGVAVLVVTMAMFGLILRSPSLAARIGTQAGRSATVAARPLRRGVVFDWGDGAVRFRDSTLGLLHGRAVWITLTTVTSHLSLYLVLLVALRHVGVSNDELSWVQVLAAFAFVRLLSAVPVTPGGLGVVELGLTAAMGAGLPDTTKSQIAAAVLLYRALTWFVPIPLGMICWIFWRSNTSWRRTVEERRAETVSVGTNNSPWRQA